MKYVKVKDAPGFVRDMQTNAVLNADVSALQAYKRKRNKQKELDNSFSEVSTMKTNINKMEHEIQEIKVLMQRILDKIG
jgi:hypothetical protein